MPRKRFSRYKFALKANDGEASASTALGKYKAYTTGATKPTYVQSADSNPQALNEIWIYAFQSADEDAVFRSSISKRSVTNIGDANLALADLNHVTPTADTLKISTPRFSAARAIVAVAGTGTTKETSKITGIQYNKKINLKSYGFPFGRKSGAISASNSFSGIAGAIRAKATPSGSPNTLSFKPEIFIEG